MADVIYKVQSPDGTILKIQGPEGASESDLQAEAQKHYDAFKSGEWENNNPISPVPSVNPAKQNLNFADKVIENLPNELFATPHPTAQIAVGAMKPLAGLAEYAGITAPAEVLNRLSARFEEGKSPAMSKALDVTGQILPVGAGTKAITEIPQLAQYLPNAINAIKSVAKASPVAKYAITGAGQAGLTPVTTPENKDQSYLDMLEQKIINMGEGAGLGAVLGKAGQMITNPKVSDKLQMLKDMGMKYFTPGQLMSDISPFGIPIGKGIQKAEQALTSLPLAGSIIHGGLETSIKDFNTALANKVLEPLGQKVPKNVPAGSEMIHHVQEAIDESYGNAVKNAHFGDYFDPHTKTGTVERLWNGFTDATNDLIPSQRNAIQNDVTKNIIENIESSPVLSGEQYRNMEKYLGNESHQAFLNGKEALGEAYKRIQDMLRTELRLQNPSIAKELENTHKAFRLFQPVEKAAAMVGSREGVFTPQQFRGAAKASAGTAGTASAQGLMIPESRAGMDVLGATLPNSGTADRALTSLTAGKVLEGGANLLTAGAPLLATASLYNPLSLRAMTKLATERPASLKAMEPQVTGALSQLGGALPAQPSVGVYDPATGQPVTQQQPYTTPQ